ncbi:hypothetical protein GCM10010357_12950 [Streptomyces luteireticuli]|uniref:HTH arsR-type domain-containing protein n=1 Tax=Streptomyces luteireticuli TaxID=173858 RepID=A0ABP3I908_9ACTN
MSPEATTIASSNGKQRVEQVRRTSAGHKAGSGSGRESAANAQAGTPLYQLKAEFFKTLGHPARIRVLELLSVREHAVAELLPEVGLEPAALSQQLAVLRRANLVLTRREGSNVFYRLAAPELAELLRVARSILSGVLQGQAELLADLRAAAP